MEGITLFPIWRQAVADFLAENFEPGAIIKKKWLEEHFDIQPIIGKMTAAQFQERQFKWLASMESFRSCLLEEHQILLHSVYGEGYRVVPPHEQTEHSAERFEKEATKAYARAATAMKNVQVDKLTDEQRRHNTDAIAKLSMLRGMHVGALK